MKQVKQIKPKIIETILLELKEYLQELYQNNLDKIILYGSRARGDNQPCSDVDILIVLKHPFNYSQEIEKTSDFIAQFSLKNNLVISRSFMTAQKFYYQQNPFLRNI